MEVASHRTAVIKAKKLPWEHNLVTSSLAATLAYRILTLWAHALRETMASLPEAVLKIFFQK
jgi:hypothetical protein